MDALERIRQIRSYLNSPSYKKKEPDPLDVIVPCVIIGISLTIIIVCLFL